MSVVDELLNGPVGRLAQNALEVARFGGLETGEESSPFEVVSTKPVYRLRRLYLAVGVGCTSFFVVIGVASTLAALFNIDGSFPHPRTFAAVFAIAWSCWCLLGGYIVLAYFRERLFVNPHGVRHVGCFRSQTIPFDQLESARWRADGWDGNLVLRAPGRKIVVHFHNFSAEDRLDLVRFFRSTLDDRLQQNWPQFHSRHID